MIIKEIEISGVKVTFKSSAAVPRLYRAKFQRDVFKDFAKLEKAFKSKTEDGENIPIEDLELFENLAYIMALAADNTVPTDIDEWLDQFDMFSIYEVLPEIIELWGTNMQTDVNGIKTTVSNVFNSIKTTISNIFNGIKETATTVWNAIKTAITTPIDNAKEKVKAAIDAIKGFFSGLKLELPHIKLPHFSISGSFSLSPPSVPHINIDWYKEGGIMAGPTIFGMNGSSLMAGGEAGKPILYKRPRLQNYRVI